MKSIINADSKLKINGKVIWLEKGVFYVLPKNDFDKTSEELISNKNNLEVYGSVQNDTKPSKIQKTSKTNTIEIPVINGETRSYINDGPNSKRYYLTLFVENVIVNNYQTSKVFLKTAMDYRSCSFWRCTWKSDINTTRTLTFNVTVNCTWNLQVYNGETMNVTGSQTRLLASREGSGAPCSLNFLISGNISTIGFNNYVWNQSF